MKNKSLVSIIITTKNSQAFISDCLASLQKQSYKNIEIIVVDNNSIDHTKEIAKKFTTLVFNKGPERSAQRNFGAKKAKGAYVLFLDVDMVLTEKVIEDCIAKINTETNISGIIIPEESFGIGFWAKIKAFERSFYVGDDTVEAARFYKKSIFEEVGGFDENITGPEDWDLSEKVKEQYKLGRIRCFILHNEGKMFLLQVLRKKYYYYQKLPQYISNKKNNSSKTGSLQKLLFFLRPGFRRGWRKLLAHPSYTIAMCYMLTLETIASGFGVVKSLIFTSKHD